MTETSQILLAHHLKALKLPTFRREYDMVARLCATEGVDHPRYLMRLAEMEMIDRERRMVDRRIKAAKLPTVKCLDSFDFLALPSLNEMLVLELARVPRDRPADRLGLGLHAKCRPSAGCAAADGSAARRGYVSCAGQGARANGRHENGVFTASEHVNAGLAISMRGGGLIAPAIMEADELNLDKVMDAMRDLVARTRAGRLRNSELTLGTITVSSMGDGGVDALLGVIYPPQVALVGFGTPRLRSMIVDGALAPRMAVTATLSADHRVSDGRHGATLLTEFDRRLREPEAL